MLILQRACSFHCFVGVFSCLIFNTALCYVVRFVLGLVINS